MLPAVMRRILVLGLLIAIALLLHRWARAPGTVLYFGGPIVTMDARQPRVDALLTEGDRIVALGSVEAVTTQARGRVRRVDLAGRALLPGFIDAHGHFPGAGVYRVFEDLNSPPMGSTETIEDVVDAMRGLAQQVSPGDWVVGMGYDDTLLKEKRHPTRRDLDRASVEHPIAVLHVSGHLLVLNSAGLARMGVGPDTPDPDGGSIGRESGGTEPSGLLAESAAEPLQHELFEFSTLEQLKIVRHASALYLKAGVTTAQSGLATEELVRGFALLSRLGLLPLRLVVWPDEGAADALLAGRIDLPDRPASTLRRGAVKLVADGSIQGYTGYLTQPYHVPPGDDPGYRGYGRWSVEELTERVTRFHAAGLQVAVHGNGDAAIDDILTAFESAYAKHPRDDARHVIIHAQMARDDQLERMRRLGIIPSFFSLHTYYWGDRHREIFMGPQRAARMSPARSALDRGLRITIHADAPVVPMEPLRLVWSAVNRVSTSGRVMGAEERIGAEEALRAVTIDAAYQHFDEGEVGSLEAGKRADMVVLSRSPLEETETIDRIRVLQTIVGGRSVYRAEN